MQFIGDFKCDPLWHLRSSDDEISQRSQNLEGFTFLDFTNNNIRSMSFNKLLGDVFE